MTRIDGRRIAAGLREDLAARVAALARDGVTPGLAVVSATADEGSAAYVRSLVRAGDRLGVAVQVTELDRASDAGQIRAALAAAAARPGVHGVLCQTPLPAGVALAEVAGAIPPESDVDGASPVSLGLLAAGLDGAFAPATAAAVLRVLDAEGVDLAGKRVVVIGRSTVVGKPLALLLLARHATVTVCHTRTRDLPAVAREADVLVAAAGRPGMVTAGYVRPGAVVIDVGTNATPTGDLVGDVDIDAVEPVAAAVTPVPGGVGAVTTLTLLAQVVTAAGR